MTDWNSLVSLLPKKIRIGTRGSALALAQAAEVKNRLLAAYPLLGAERVEIVPIKTTGDNIQDKNLNEIGGKGLFTKEIEEALMGGDIELAVHSMKDMPAFEPAKLITECFLPREDPRDAFVSLKYHSLVELPEGAVVGTSSSRRKAQLLLLRPDIRVVPFRGNVQTRLRKLEEGQADATFLAVAGLNRLSMSEAITVMMDPSEMLPAVAQGVIGVQCRQDHATIRQLLAAIHDEETAYCVRAERAFLETLEGGCSTPMAGYAELHEEMIEFRALIAKTDGTLVYRTSGKAPKEEAALLGRKAGLELKHKDDGVILCA
jgi:hydroxymethylbilane synthase